jgi:peroxiredoxin
MKSSLLFTGCFAAVAALIAVTSHGSRSSSPFFAAATIESGAKAPDWKLKDLQGKDVSSTDFKGKVVVIDFWATWCTPCRGEIPGYVELQKKYKDQGLVIVGLSVDQGGAGLVKKFVQEYKVNYPVVLADDGVVSAFGGVEAIPTTFVLDRSGKVAHKKVGAVATEDFEKILVPLLK